MKRIISSMLVLSLSLSSTALAGVPMLTITRSAGAGAGKAAGLVGYNFRQLVLKDGRYTHVDLVKTLGTNDKTEHNFGPAEELVAKGRAAYEALDLDAAIQYLSYALNRYQRDIGYVEDPSTMANLLLLMAASHILRGEERAGSERLSQALEIFPRAEPDPRIFNPAMRKKFDDVAAQVQRRPTGKMTINSTPSYAEVYVDGTFRGITPLTVENLVQGQHLVHIYKPGYEPGGSLTGVQARADVPFNVSLKPLNAFETFEKNAESAASSALQTPRKIDNGMQELAKLTKAQNLLISNVRINGDRVQVDASLYDMVKNKRIGTESTAFSYSLKPDAYAPEILDLYNKILAGDIREEESQKGEVPPGQIVRIQVDKECFLCKGYNAAAVSILSAGVGAAGAGTAFWLLARAAHADFKQSAQTNSDDIKTKGRREALIGDGLMLLGAACVITGSAMLIAPLFKNSKKKTASSEQDNHLTVGATPLQGGGFLNASVSF
jgi:hypothetical protein